MSLINGKEYELTVEEKNAVIVKMNKGGVAYLNRLDLAVNTSSISGIEPTGLSARSVDRSKQFEGVLATGERVVKRFGNWYLANGSVDDDGNPCVRPDPDYYPEIKAGLLPTPEEYERKYYALPGASWPALLAGSDPERPQFDIGERKSNGLTAFGKI